MIKLCKVAKSSLLVRRSLSAVSGRGASRRACVFNLSRGQTGKPDDNDVAPSRRAGWQATLHHGGFGGGWNCRGIVRSQWGPSCFAPLKKKKKKNQKRVYVQIGCVTLVFTKPEIKDSLTIMYYITPRHKERNPDVVGIDFLKKKIMK